LISHPREVEANTWPNKLMHSVPATLTRCELDDPLAGCGEPSWMRNSGRCIGGNQIKTLIR
jgi:hypothetical protein